MDRWNAFLARHPETPDTAVELQHQAKIKLVVTDNSDPDKIGTFQRWRPASQSRVAPIGHVGGRVWVHIGSKSIFLLESQHCPCHTCPPNVPWARPHILPPPDLKMTEAFYVAGELSCLHNFIYLLDAWWVDFFKDKPKAENVHLHPHTTCDIDACWDELQYEVYTLEERATKLPLGIFEAHPPQSRRIVQITIQVETESVLSFLFHGGTWLYRGAFDALQIPGFRDENNTYYRVVQSVDSAKAEDQQRVLNILGDDVLHNVAARVSTDGWAPAGTPSHAFLKSLRERHHLFFV